MKMIIRVLISVVALPWNVMILATIMLVLILLALVALVEWAYDIPCPCGRRTMHEYVSGCMDLLVLPYTRK